MRLYSTHFRPAGPQGGTQQEGRPPVLVKEGFSWRCLVLGWIGLLLSGSWIAALLAGAVTFIVLAMLRHVPGAWPVAAGLQLLLAGFAHDLRRWELRLRGFTEGPPVAGGNADAAMLRLLDRRPELLGGRT